MTNYLIANLSGVMQSSQRINNRLITSFLVFILLCQIGLRIHNGCSYNFSIKGHDGGSHADYLTSLAHHLSIKKKNNQRYNPPVYYFFVLAHTKLAGTIDSSQIWGNVLNNTVVLANTHLFLWCIGGLFFLGKKVGFSLNLNLIFIILTLSVPVFQRIFNMARPEILTLATTPWVFGLAKDLMDNPEKKGLNVISIKFWILVLLSAIGLTSKVCGLFVLSGLLFYIFFKQTGSLLQKAQVTTTLCIIVLMLAIPILIIHHKMSNVPFFEHPGIEGTKYSNSAPLSFFTNLSFRRLLISPYRNHHSDSMMGILLSDLYGDYWGYGVWSRVLREDPPKNKLRFSVLSSMLFFVLYLLALISLVLKMFHIKHVKNLWDVLTMNVIVMGAILYLIIACEIAFNPVKGDTVKWEYIIWAVPFMTLCITFAVTKVEWRKLNKVSVFTIGYLVFTGFYMSIC